MYEQVFHFNSRPFTATPFVKHYFAADSIQQALEQSRICVDRGSGPAIVVGGAGTGKTLLLAMLEEQYRSQFNVVNLGCARLGERCELLQSVLFELQLPYKDMSETELRFSLIDYLKPSERCPNGILLLVDEAHTLSTELLDEVRLITNFVRDGEPRVRLVMAGNQRLEENLNESKLESFNQRIAARCYLQKMSRDETARYVVEHIDRAGGEGNQLFSEASLKAIHEVSDGCPRLVNQVCDQVLILTATRGLSEITDSCIREAWADVQSIPGSFAPSTDRPSETSDLDGEESWTVIEFGQLDETEDEVQSAEPLEDSQLAAEVNEFSEIIESFAEDEGLVIDETNPESDSITHLESEDDDLGEFVVEAPAYSGEPIEMHVSDDDWGDQSPVDQRLDELDSLEEQLHEIEAGNDLADAVGHELEDGLQADHDAVFKAAVNSLVGHGVDEAQDELDDSEEPNVPFEDLAFELENREISDELETNLIGDDVAESEPEETQVEPVIETVDPFSESFDDEEYLVDRYAPFVAHQNQSSLTVTSDDLALIQPIDQLDEDGLPSNDEYSRPAVYQAEESDEPVTDDEVEEAMSVDSLRECLDADESVVEFETEEAVAESFENEDTLAQQSEEEKILYELGPEPVDAENNAAVEYHDHLIEAESSDVEQQAEEILKRLGVSCETDGADQLVDVDAVSNETSIPAVVRSVADSTVGEVADQESDFETQNAALDETQQILNEILEQKNLLALQQDQIQNGNEESAASMKVEHSLADLSSQQGVESTNDDREMIIVSRMEELAESVATQDESIPFPTTPVSTGRAERMDYQKLFEQLRDASNPEN